MRPDRETNNAFVYCMALAAQKSHVEPIFKKREPAIRANAASFVTRAPIPFALMIRANRVR
ncbi:MAG: hypothetical protein JXP73_13930, partial [Deltaproteobacteria bacterium]|nr:hypothetical protein [Deltaproteobacteria bacterium]